MSEVGTAGFGRVGEGDGDVFGILESNGGVREEGQGRARREADLVLAFQGFLKCLEDAARRLGRGRMVDDGLIDVSNGADGMFVDENGKVTRQVTKSLSGGVGLVVDLDGGLRGVRHAKELMVDERMEVFRFAFRLLCVCGFLNGFFR